MVGGGVRGSEYRHYRLCLDSEVAGLAAEHDGERIVPLPYGAGFAQLAGFLRALAPGTGGGPARVNQSAPHLPGRPVTIGRDDELDAVVNNLLSEPLLPSVILGPPGIGKTNLTLASLHAPSVAARFGTRRWFVRCETATTAAAVAAEAARALGSLGATDHLAAVKSALGQEPAVIVLDNLETAWEADTLATEELLGEVAGIPGVALIVSLRERSARVEPLGLHRCASSPLELAKLVSCSSMSRRCALTPPIWMSCCARLGAYRWHWSSSATSPPAKRTWTG